MLRRGPAARLTFTPEGGTARARTLRRVGWVLLLTGGILLIGFLAAVNLVADSEEKLFQEGVRTPGTVAEYHPSTRGGGTMDVRFAVDTAERVRTIRLNSSSPRYQVGQQVTVVYDRADPERIRTDVEENESFWVMLSLIIACITGVMLLLAGVVVCFRWGGRYRDVRDFGWRPGRATIRLTGGRLILDVRLDNGRTLQLREYRLRTRRPPYTGEAEVLVGGEGTTVLFRNPLFVSAAQVIEPVR